MEWSNKTNEKRNCKLRKIETLNVLNFHYLVTSQSKAAVLNFCGENLMKMKRTKCPAQKAYELNIEVTLDGEY